MVTVLKTVAQRCAVGSNPILSAIGLQCSGNTLGSKPRNKSSILLRPANLYMERWQSGLLHFPAKEEWGYIPPWVQIPLSPPINMALQLRWIEQWFPKPCVTGSTPVRATIYELLAQGVERSPHKRLVVGSIQTGFTKISFAYFFKKYAYMPA